MYISSHKSISAKYAGWTSAIQCAYVSIDHMHDYNNWLQQQLIATIVLYGQQSSVVFLLFLYFDLFFFTKSTLFVNKFSIMVVENIQKSIGLMICKEIKWICQMKRDSLASLVHNNLFRSLVTTSGCGFVCWIQWYFFPFFTTIIKDLLYLYANL